MRWHPRKASLRRKREQADDAQGRKRFGGRSAAICIALFASWYFFGDEPRQFVHRSARDYGRLARLFRPFVSLLERAMSWALRRTLTTEQTRSLREERNSP